MSRIAGRRTTDLDAHIPPAGGWRAQGHLDSGAPLALGAATLTIGDLDLVGTVTDSYLDAPEHPMFVLEGGAGWNKLLPAPGASYSSPSGVRLSTVLRDLAELAGELYDAPPEAKLDTSYGWDASTEKPIRARHVLDDLVARKAIPTWRVAPNGRTRFDAWPSLPAADALGVIEDREMAQGVRDVALQASVAAWLPGATVQGARILRLELHETGAELRAKVWTAPTPLKSLRSIILGLFPWLARCGLAPSGALALRGVAGRTELEGGGRAAAGKGHAVVRLSYDNPPTTLYYSTDLVAPFSWTAVPPAALPGPPLPTDAGVLVRILEGSGKVQIDG